LLPDWVDRLAQIGVIRSDSDQETVRKATLTLTSALITVLAVIWVATYGALGLWLSALIPFAYQLASVASIAALARAKRYRFFRASQLSMMLVLPFLLQWSLGGFGESSAWLCGRSWPRSERSCSWTCAGLSHGSWAFVALVVISGLIDARLTDADVPDWTAITFFVMNVLGVSTTV
jgi:hypothetical protein